jgi:hypothetical protein
MFSSIILTSFLLLKKKGEVGSEKELKNQHHGVKLKKWFKFSNCTLMALVRDPIVNHNLY